MQLRTAGERARCSACIALILSLSPACLHRKRGRRKEGGRRREGGGRGREEGGRKEEGGRRKREGGGREEEGKRRRERGGKEEESGWRKREGGGGREEQGKRRREGVGWRRREGGGGGRGKEGERTRSTISSGSGSHYRRKRKQAPIRAGDHVASWYAKLSLDTALFSNTSSSPNVPAVKQLHNINDCIQVECYYCHMILTELLFVLSFPEVRYTISCSL